MLIEVKVPQLSESVAEATLLTWHKKPGERVRRDENLVDIETDKVVLETPAPESGVITRIMPARERVAVLLDFLGRQTAVEIPADSVIKQADARASIP